MSAIIDPVRDVATGEIKTNVQVVRELNGILNRLRDGYAGQSDTARRRDLREYNRMTNGDPSIHTWINHIASIPDDRVAQRMIEDTLIPLDGVVTESKAALTKKERLKGGK